MSRSSSTYVQFECLAPARETQQLLEGNDTCTQVGDFQPETDILNHNDRVENPDAKMRCITHRYKWRSRKVRMQ